MADKQDKRTETVTAWATEVQALSSTHTSLADSAVVALTSSDLARSTTRDLAMPFETEPSAFVQLLNDLAPDDGCGR